MGTNMRDGMGFEEVNETVTSTAIISGTNIYGTTSGLFSKVQATTSNLGATTTTTVNGTTIIASTLISGTGVNSAVISGTNIRSNNALFNGSDVANGLVLVSAGTGSPTTWGKLVQGGTGALGGGSTAWVTFGTGFAATPTVVVCQAPITAGNNDLIVIAGSLNAGSFYIQGKTASEAFNWIAL